MNGELKAPFPWMGGKAAVADLVWDRLGDVDNFIEPFAGSLAVLLRRPHTAVRRRAETVNDKNHYLSNFWRAVAADPDAVARYADWPVSEIDMHSRHRWLVKSDAADAFRKAIKADPDHYDAKIAGWWVWGQCLWIGGGWCQYDGWEQVPHLARAGGHGVCQQQPEQVPHLGDTGGYGVHRRAEPVGSLRNKLPDLDSSRGVAGRPQLTDAYDCGRGVAANWQAGTCEQRREWLTQWMRRLSDRLRLVRVCYGEWHRVCDSDSTLTRLGTTGVFLDPPYPARRGDTGERSRDPNLYATDAGADLDALRDEVLAWCQRHGSNPEIRIAVCGYEGDGYEKLEGDGWDVVAWKTNGGYGNQAKKGGKANENAGRERIWFSPACHRERGLFD